MKGPSRISTTLPPIDSSSSSNNNNNYSRSSSSGNTNKAASMKQLLTPSSTRSVQGTRVQQELEILRQKHLAQSQRNKLKDRTLFTLAILPSIHVTHTYCFIIPAFCNIMFPPISHHTQFARHL